MPLGSAPSLPDWPEEPAPEPVHGAQAAKITTRIVGLLRVHTGKGPSRARTAITADLVIVTLSDSLTTMERRLVEGGNGALILHGRRALHRDLRDEASAIVEKVTGRRVTAYLTAQDGDPDLALLIFSLARRGPLAA